MDDVKAAIEQVTDAMGNPPEASAEVPKPEMKKVRRAAKKVARKVEPKKKAGKKAKKSAKKSAKKAPKPRKRRQRRRSAEAKRKTPDEGPVVFCFRLLEGEHARRRSDAAGRPSGEASSGSSVAPFVTG